MRACVIQVEAGSDKPANIATVGRWMAQAVSADRPDFVSLPEMWSCLGGTRAEKFAAAEVFPAPGGTGEPGSAYAFLQAAAVAHEVTLHGGSVGERAGETLFNTTLVFGPGGRELARYRKIHLFDVTTPNGRRYHESASFGAGEAVVAVPASGAMLGLSICYDLRFAELYLALRRAGAQVIAVPAAFTAQTGRDHWEVLLRARAIDTQCWVVAAATCGAHADAAGQPRETWGHSMIIDPWGRVVAQLEDLPGFATASLDMAVADQVRMSMPVLSHRRLG